MATKGTGRRKFIQAGLAAAAVGIPTFTQGLDAKVPAKSMFIHHVYFWLKNPTSQEDFNKLVDGLKKLSKVKTIRSFHIGKPAETNRSVIDRSYQVSWMLMFDNLEDEELYQKDPIHLKFVEDCAALWSKVVVYDSVDL